MNTSETNESRRFAHEPTLADTDWFVRERLRICAYVDHDRGGWAVRTRVELVFAFDAICATRFEGRPANAAPSEVQMDGCTFGRDDQASSSRRKEEEMG